MKKTVLCSLCVLLSFCLIGCGGTVKIDIQSAVDELMPKIGFDEQLFNVEDERAEKTYDVESESVKDCIAYVSSAAVVDEFSIWEAVDAKSADAIEEKAAARVSAQREVYSTYNTDQLKKLDSAVILHKGNYVVLCISNDNETAKELLNNYFK